MWSMRESRTDHQSRSHGQPSPDISTWHGRTDIFRYPGGLAWQLSAPKRIVRKSPPFKVFQRFLVGETEVVRC